MHAHAGAFRNNCAFHCIAHTLFSKNNAEIHKLFYDHPVLTDIMINFYDYYGLGDNYDIDQFIKLIEQFSHPEDREILLGPVFRKTLQDQVNNEPTSTTEHKYEVKEGNLISDELIGQFAIQMGAKITIHATEKLSEFDLIYSDSKPSWNVELFHTTRGGGHYNFSYGEDYLDESHNIQFDPPNQYGVVKPRGNSLLSSSANLTGVAEQNSAIKQIVQEQYQVLTERTSNSPSI
jgi:hypothetical protein